MAFVIVSFVAQSLDMGDNVFNIFNTWDHNLYSSVAFSGLSEYFMYSIIFLSSFQFEKTIAVISDDVIQNMYSSAAIISPNSFIFAWNNQFRFFSTIIIDIITFHTS